MPSPFGTVDSGRAAEVYQIPQDGLGRVPQTQAC
jgi:hypothetical protein